MAAPLAVGLQVAGLALGLFSSSRAKKRARAIANANADKTLLEGKQGLQDNARTLQQKKSEAIARVSASGLKLGGSIKSLLDATGEISATSLERQKTAFESRAQIERQGGAVAANNIRDQFLSSAVSSLAKIGASASSE